MKPAVRNVIIAVAVLAFAVIFGLAFWKGFREARDPAKVRATAIASGLPACVKTAKAGIALRGGSVSDATINSYCDCAVKQMIGALSDEQLLQPGLSPEAALGPRAEEIVKTCAQQTLTR